MIKYRVIYEINIPESHEDIIEEDPFAYSAEYDWFPDLIRVERIGE